MDGPGSIPGVGGDGEYSPFFRAHTGPGVYSASYKMIPRGGGLSPGVKAAERRTSHPTASYCRAVAVYMLTFASTAPWAFMARNGDPCSYLEMLQ